MLFAFPAAGLLLLPLEVVWPSAASSLLHEDSAIEWVTALASAAAAVAAAYVARLLWSDGRRRHAAMYALVAIGAILATGEEMSWGQRVVGFGTPESLREANEQEELNVHNLGDVYPAYLGALLFECLAGHPPFHPATDVELLRLQLSGTPPELRTLRPDVPAPLAGAIARALAKRPEERWGSAAEFAAGLGG